MTELRILVANPDAQVIEHPGHTWVVASGVDTSELARLIPRLGTGPVDMLGGFIGVAEDATVIHIAHRDGRPARLECYRSLLSQLEVYWIERADGSVILTDNMRDAIAALPPAERESGLTQFVGHLAFPYVSGRDTHVANIRRLAKGDVWTMRSDARETMITVAERWPAGPGEASPDEAADEVDSALAAPLGAMAARPGTVNLLSGGIDSSLVQSYLGPGFESLSVSIDSPEFAFETEYALAASQILESRHEVRILREADYLERLELIVETLGYPPSVLQTALILAALESNHTHYLTGELADTLFAPDPRHIAALSGAAAGGLADDDPIRRAIEEPVDSPQGYALSRYRLSPDLPLIRAMYGDDRVDRLILDRYRLLTDSLAGYDAYHPNWIRHLAVGSLMSLVFFETLSSWRQIGFRHGKRLLTPFITRRVANAAFGIRLPDRYVVDGRTKPVLRVILSRRALAFPVDAPKGGTGLPRTRYLQHGPLRGAIQAYGMPVHIPAEHRGSIENAEWETSWTAFAALTYAIWRARVLGADLKVSPGTRQLAWAAST